MPWPYDFSILLYDAFDSPSAFCYISLKPSYETYVSRSIDIELEIQKISHSLVIKNHDAIDYYKLLRFNPDELITSPMMNEVILRHHAWLSVLEIRKVLKHEIHIESIGTIEVVCRYILIIYERRTLVVIILCDKHGFRVLNLRLSR